MEQTHKPIYEFFFGIGKADPVAIFKFSVEKICEKTIFGSTTALNIDGTEKKKCSNFRLFKTEVDDLSYQRFRESADAIRIRVVCENFEDALKIAKQRYKKQLLYWANEINDNTTNLACENRPNVKIGDVLYQIKTEPYGCHACPHGNQPSRHLCPYTCPEQQFRVEEVEVTNLRQVLQLTPTGEVVLIEGFYKTRKEAEDQILIRIEDRKKNKHFFDNH